jgi:CIC family chloride channel protein
MRNMSDTRAGDEERCWELIGEGIYVDGNATLEVAMPIFDRTSVPFVPVVTLAGEDAPPELLGALFHVDALKAYNRALAATAAEEHS